MGISHLRTLVGISHLRTLVGMYLSGMLGMYLSGMLGMYTVSARFMTFLLVLVTFRFRFWPGLGLFNGLFRIPATRSGA